MELNEQKKIAENSKEGVWIDWEDAQFKIRSTTSKEYRKAVLKAGKGKSNHKLTKDVDTAEEFGVEAMSDGLLLDWKNVTEGGKELPCTRANKIKVLTIAAPIRDFIASQAQDHATFELEGEAEDAETFQGGGPVEPPVGEGDGSAAGKGRRGK
tara:strand:- start:162 stop:623 length:462 start_codon:yes stop_codon:yes gene_type:complete